jgi:hypothetical protein
MGDLQPDCSADRPAPGSLPVNNKFIHKRKKFVVVLQEDEHITNHLGTQWAVRAPDLLSQMGCSMKYHLRID